MHVGAGRGPRARFFTLARSHPRRLGSVPRRCRRSGARAVAARPPRRSPARGLPVPVHRGTHVPLRIDRVPAVPALRPSTLRDGGAVPRERQHLLAGRPEPDPPGLGALVPGRRRGLVLWLVLWLVLFVLRLDELLDLEQHQVALLRIADRKATRTPERFEWRLQAELVARRTLTGLASDRREDLQDRRPQEFDLLLLDQDRDRTVPLARLQEERAFTRLADGARRDPVDAFEIHEPILPPSSGATGVRRGRPCRSPSGVGAPRH